MTTNVIEKQKPIDNKVDETIAHELFNKFHKVTPIEITKQFKRNAEKTIVFDKMSISLSTTGVEKVDSPIKMIENYYNQIKNNEYVSKKGMYLVCRDLFDAKVNLNKESYKMLLAKLSYNESSVYKQEAIGSDFRLFKMFNQGRLPETWTTQYALTQFNDEEFKRVLDDKNINHQSTLSEIKKVAKVENNSTTDNKIALLGIGSLKVDKTKVEKNDFSKFQKDIKKFMNNYKFLTIEFANGFKETIDALVDTRENKDRNSNSISA